VALPGERWVLAPAALGRFLATVAAPMTLGPITLADGSAAIGFHCDHATALTRADITAHGGWLRYLRNRAEAHALPEAQELPEPRKASL
jgi:hypothetical protein